MPASEETWRSPTLLHRLFAVTGVGLLLATIWMFAADHYREWKPYQRNMVKIDTTLTRMQEEQYQTEENLRERDQLQRNLTSAKVAPLDELLFQEFQTEAHKTQPKYSFAWLDAKVARLKELSADAAQQRSRVEKIQSEVKKLEVQTAASQTALAKNPSDEAVQKESTARQAEFEKRRAEVVPAEKEAQEAESAADKAGADESRAEIIEALQEIIKKARFREDVALNNRKLAAANLDAKKAELGILERDGMENEAGEAKSKIKSLTTEFNDLTLVFQDAQQHRKNLLDIVKRLTQREEAAREDLKKNEAGRRLLESAFKERQSTYFVGMWPGKRWLELPILDAFGSPRKPDNLWSEGNLIDYNFSETRRFDRCTTCHQAMEKSAAGSPSEPAYVRDRQIELVLTTPAAADLAAQETGPDGQKTPRTLEGVYGVRLAERGLLNDNDVTVSLVEPGKLGAQASLAPQKDSLTARPGEEIRRELLAIDDETAAAAERAGLLVGDVLVKVNDDEVNDKPQFERLVLGPSVKWGSPLRITVRRGLPNPYISHPRLDLFVGSLSPHKMQTFGCTICHDGQGSATAFKWASHTPNDPEQRKAWALDYGWFDNHHWILPQNPKRFLESGCLKCHHNVTELEASPRFPEPPAPKVVRGHDLIRKYGCYGCHEINGFDGPNKRVGPDMRSEPAFYAVAEELSTHLPGRLAVFQPQLDERTKKLAPFGELTTKKIELDDAIKKLNEQKIPDDEKKQKLEPLSAELKTVDEDLAKQRESLKDEIEETTLLQAHVSRLGDAARLAERLIRFPEEDAVRRNLRHLLEVDKASKGDAFGQTFGVNSHRLTDLLKDIEVPGTLRKPGPSLRHAASKLDPAFLVDWIREPKHFRPSTRMPQFFGLTDHLKGNANEPADTEQKEKIEILGIATYLLDRSQKFEYLAPAEGAADEDRQAKIARGKQQFQIRGCLACHNHQDFPETKTFRPATEIVQGPELSGLSAKFSSERNPNGRKWLYSWIKEPSRYHARTFMPNVFLETTTDAAGKVTDAADDVVEYLLSVPYDAWKSPADVNLDENGKFQLDAATRIALVNPQDGLNGLALENLKETFFVNKARDYLENGIPESMRGDLKGAEVELIGQKVTDKELLLYIGRKSIGKYGCYGCHDIPGFEDAKPNGTGLADWGRKEPAKLAFELIDKYLHEHGPSHGKANGKVNHGAAANHAEAGHKEKLPPFYAEQINAGNRIGFIFQKLKEPRSYDYLKTQGKRYNERLRMPQFSFTDEEREAIVTFVLGLVADPPTPKYVYAPSQRQIAITQGRQVLEKYNCGGCHILEMDKWKVASTPKDNPGAGTDDQSKVYPFLRSVIGPDEIEASKKPDRRNRLHAMLTALPALRGLPGDDGLPEMYDSEGDQVTNEDKYAPETLRVALDLWEPVLLNGRLKQVGGTALQVPVREIERHYPSRGGMLAKYLIQPVFKQQKALDSSAKVTEAWGWLPPPLLGEGNKVQAEWLHDFLLDPHPIRPAVVLRMPGFNMSPGEATKVASYFAAVDNADYPYEFGERRRQEHLANADEEYGQKIAAEGAAPGANAPSRTRLDDAMKVVTNVCVKCHLVGDYEPSGTKLVKGPNLARVDRRLKPTYLRDWIADPKRFLPYTGMPVNVPFDEFAPNYGTTVAQDLYHGHSVEQLHGLVDLLANYDEFAKRRTSVKPMVKVEGAPAAEGASAGKPAESN